MSRERKPPKMTGPFAQVAEDFIQYKRSCGFKYENEPKCLSRFCRFAQEHGVTSVEITRELAEAWISPKESISDRTRAHNITCIRQLAIYLDSIGYKCLHSPRAARIICEFICTLYFYARADQLDNQRGRCHTASGSC